MKFQRILGLAIAFGLGYTSTLLVPPSALLASSPDDNPAPQAARLAEPAGYPQRVAQQEFGFRCSTPEGICSLSQPQPIGSVCYCRGVRGTTIR
jgi:hypothetical protein